MATTGLKAGSIPVPEPNLTPREMVERATSLRPFLRDKQAETEAARRILDEVNERFVAAGFYRLLQPKRFGGYEFDRGEAGFDTTGTVLPNEVNRAEVALVEPGTSLCC